MPVLQNIEDTASRLGEIEDIRARLTDWTNFKDRMRLKEMYKAAKKTVGIGNALAAYEGSAKSLKDMDNGVRDQWMIDTLGHHPTTVLGELGADTLRVLENVGNAATYGYAGKFGSDPKEALRTLGPDLLYGLSELGNTITGGYAGKLGERLAR